MHVRGGCCSFGKESNFGSGLDGRVFGVERWRHLYESMHVIRDSYPACL